MCQIIFLESFNQHQTPVHTHTHTQTHIHTQGLTHWKFPLLYSTVGSRWEAGRRGLEEESGGDMPACIMVNAFCQVRLATPHISNYHSSPSKLPGGGAGSRSFTLGTGSQQATVGEFSDLWRYGSRAGIHTRSVCMLVSGLRIGCNN